MCGTGEPQGTQQELQVLQEASTLHTETGEQGVSNMGGREASDDSQQASILAKPASTTAPLFLTPPFPLFTQAPPYSPEAEIPGPKVWLNA